MGLDSRRIPRFSPPPDPTQRHAATTELGSARRGGVLLILTHKWCRRNPIVHGVFCVTLTLSEPLAVVFGGRIQLT